MKMAFKRAIGRMVCVGIAFSFFLGLFSLSFPAYSSNDLVYCPLQKVWVERSPERKNRPALDLDDMCAADRLKLSFIREFTVSNSAKAYEDPEATFWNYLTSGEVSGELPSKPTTPENFRIGRIFSTVGGQQNDRVLDVEQILAISLFARPPTDEKQIVLAYRWLVDQTHTIGSTQPRAPPIS